MPESVSPKFLRELPKGSIPVEHYAAVTRAARRYFKSDNGREDPSGSQARARQGSTSINAKGDIALEPYTIYSLADAFRHNPDIALNADTPWTGSPYYHFTVDEGTEIDSENWFLPIDPGVPIRVKHHATEIPSIGESCGPNGDGEMDGRFTGYIALSGTHKVDDVDVLWCMQHNTQGLLVQAAGTISAGSTGTCNVYQRNDITFDTIEASLFPVSIKGYAIAEASSGSELLAVPVHRMGWVLIGSSGESNEQVACDSCTTGFSPANMLGEVNGISNNGASSDRLGLDIASVMNDVHALTMNACASVFYIDTGNSTEVGTGAVFGVPIGTPTRVVVGFGWQEGGATRYAKLTLYQEYFDGLWFSNDNVFLDLRGTAATIPDKLDCQVPHTLTTHTTTGLSYSSGTLEVRSATPANVQENTLGNGDTTFAANKSTIKLTGDTAGNSVATITGAMAVEGNEITVVPQDAKVLIVNDDSATANTIKLTSSWTSKPDSPLTLKRRQQKWFEKSRADIDPTVLDKAVVGADGNIVTNNGNIVWAL